jgi:hypothetical protein
MNGVFCDVMPCGYWQLQEPHGVTSQKTPFFIVTAVKISNLTFLNTYFTPSFIPLEAVKIDIKCNSKFVIIAFLKSPVFLIRLLLKTLL